MEAYNTVIDPKKKKELQELILTLEGIKGRHTELVSVLIPGGANINLTSNQLESESSTAENIKSKQVRSNVIDALNMIVRELKNYKQTPQNGLAIFCGNISQKEGEQDLKIWIYEPPKLLNVKLYRCDQEFIIDPLKEMVSVEAVYGLLVIDRQAAMIGLLEGNNIKVLQKLTSGVPGKIRAGGQCLSPDTLVETRRGKKKIRDVKIGEELKALDITKSKVIFTRCLNKWEVVKKQYMEISTSNKFSLICSKDHTLFIKFIDDSEEEMVESLVESLASSTLPGTILYNNNLKNETVVRVKNKKDSINLIDIETEEGNFFANGLLVHNSSQRFHRITEGLAKEFYRKVAEKMKDQFFDMPKLKGILIGGPIPTKEDFIDEGNLVTKLKEKIIAIKDLGYVDEHGLELLVEDSRDDLVEQELTIEKNHVKKFFETLGKDKKMAVYGKDVLIALERGAVETIYISKKLDKEATIELERRAEAIGSKVIYISTEHTDGEQFFNLTKGVGAILRFALE